MDYLFINVRMFFNWKTSHSHMHFFFRTVTLKINNVKEKINKQIIDVLLFSSHSDDSDVLDNHPEEGKKRPKQRQLFLQSYCYITQVKKVSNKTKWRDACLSMLMIMQCLRILKPSASMNPSAFCKLEHVNTHKQTEYYFFFFFFFFFYKSRYLMFAWSKTSKRRRKSTDVGLNDVV